MNKSHILFYVNLEDCLKTYDSYIEINLKDIFIHSHVPQYIHYNYKLGKYDKSKCHTFCIHVLKYVKTRKKFNKLKMTKIYATFERKKCIDCLHNKTNSEIIHLSDTSLGIFSNKSGNSYDEVISLFYKNYIYPAKFIDININFIIQNLQEKKPFTYIRIGDGEQHCIQSQFSKTFDSHNKNGCTFNTQGLSKSLIDILNDKTLIDRENIYIAWNPSPIRNRYDCFYAFEKLFTNYEMSFLIDHTALIRKLLFDSTFIHNFINCLNKMEHILYVGPDYMNDTFKNPIRYDNYFAFPISEGLWGV